MSFSAVSPHWNCHAPYNDFSCIIQTLMQIENGSSESTTSKKAILHVPIQELGLSLLHEIALSPYISQYM